MQRTYAYELADQGPDLTQREQNFGLLRYDLTEKPAFVAIENLIDLLEDPGMPAGFTPATLDYALSSPDAALHHTLLQKSDGTFYLLLWQELPGFNRFAETDINVAPLAVTLTLNDPMIQARTYLTNQSLTPTGTYTDPASINLNVLDEMLVVELTPIPEPAAGATIALAVVVPLLRRGCCKLRRPARRARGPR